MYDIVTHVIIMVTGANGFLGSWICRILSKKYEIIALVRPNSNLFRLSGIDGLIVKIFQEHEFEKIVTLIRPQILILCDWSGVISSQRNSVSQYLNVDRYRSRINALNKVKTVICLGSQAELGPVDHEILETEKDAPTSFYGDAKTEIRKFLEAELDSNVRFVWGRVFSTYGPLDSGEWMIPSTISSLLEGRPAHLTKGEQEWSFLHAYDFARAICTLISQEQLSGIVNLGNSSTTQISQVANFIGESMKKVNLLDFDSLPYRTDQVMRLFPSTQKLQAFGWFPEIELENGISHLINWMSGTRNPDLIGLDGQVIPLNLPEYSQRN